jgi:hypothetical protein
MYRIASTIKTQASSSVGKKFSPSWYVASVANRHFSTHRVETPSSIEDAKMPFKVPHMKASTRRSFSPNSNAQAMLLSGGDTLAENASFDPLYSRAKNYIRNHAVGPAVISPILIHGLVGALIESKLPQGFFVKNSLKQVRPLIVGVEVEAQYEVVSIVPSGSAVNIMNGIGGVSGYELELDTSVKRVSDGVLIAEGSQTVWLPDFLSSSA